MTLVEDQLFGPVTAPPELRVELAPDWDGGWTVRASAGDVRLSCAVFRPDPGVWILHDCLPQRRDAALADLLVAAAGQLRAELGPAEFFAIHPAEWDDRLAEHPVVPMHRMVNLGLLLDEDLLRAHRRPATGHRIVPLAEAGAAELAELSDPANRSGDQAVWQEVRSGGYGPLIDEASLLLRDETGPVAAILVSEFRGRPLIGHCVAHHQRRGEGHGRTVLIESLLRLVAAGYSECRLSVVEDNWTAHRLYRSVGFTAVQPPLRVSRILDREATDGH